MRWENPKYRSTRWKKFSVASIHCAISGKEALFYFYLSSWTETKEKFPAGDGEDFVKLGRQAVI